MSNKITYRQQFTRCGKERCRKCREGEGHGPYWYAYWSEKGRTVSKYIGIHLPPDVEIAAVQSTQEKPEPIETPGQEVAPAVLLPPSHELRVYLLGQFRVERWHDQKWQVIDHHIWQRRRARSLLGCLLNSPGRRLGREQAMDLLWPDLDVDISANRLNGAVHELRQILEPDLQRPAASRMLRLEHDVLELADVGYIWADVDEFEALLKEAEFYSFTQPLQAEYKLEEAASLYNGGYLLEELYSEWAAPRRDALQRRWIGTLLDLAQMRTQRGAFASAIEVLDRLRVADPTNETALQRLMVLLTHVDRRGEALHIYRQYATTLQREYESTPLLETKRLYESLQAGESSEVYLSQWVQGHPQPTEQAIAQAQHSGKIHSTTSSRPTISRTTFQSGRNNQSPLVGRDQELHIMREVLATLEQRAGHEKGSTPDSHAFPTTSDAIPITGPKIPHLLLLTGEPGRGKTRLAEELSNEAQSHDWMVVWSRVHEQEGNVPYHPWRVLLRSLLPEMSSIARNRHTTNEWYMASGLPTFQLDWLSPLLPELATIRRQEHLLLSYEQERLHLWEATLGFLSTLSQHYPLLLVLDDLHWADESSIELLTYLAHHLHDQRILLVGTCRDDELAPSHKLRSLVSALKREQAVVTLDIQPLTQAQIGALVAYLPEEQVMHIQKQAAGNPLFAEELARYASAQKQARNVSELHEESSPYIHRPSPYVRKERGSVEKTRPVTPSPLPEVVAALLERRLYRLSTDCQSLLGKAAVLGGSFELRQLLLMATEYAEDTTLDLLDEALQEGLLTEEGMGAQITYHFWHPLIVSHLYERLSAARRAQLHRRAAEVLRATASPSSQEKMAATLFYHLLRGGGDTSQIVHYAELAGDQARALTAYSEAHYYYLHAVHALASPPDALDISITLDVNNVIKSAEALLTPLSTENTVGPDTMVSMYHLVHLCRLLERTAECERILGFFEDERRFYECILAIRTSRLFRQRIISSDEDTVAGRDTVFSQHEIYKKRESYEAQIQALLWREMSATWVATGDYDQAYACCERGRDVMRQAGVVNGTAWACVCSQIGAILRYKGNYYEARQYAMEALTMLDHTHQPVNKHLAVTQTRTERALAGDPTYLGQAHELLGVIEASEGNLSNALAHLHIALHFYEQQKLVSEVVLVCGNLGAAYIMKGDLDAGRTFLYRALDLAERVGDLPNLAFITGNLGDIAYRSGNLLEAEDWFTKSLALAEHVHDREHISWCCVVLANVQQDLGHLHKAAKYLTRAITIGRAIKNLRSIRFALVSLGDLRLIETIIVCGLRPSCIHNTCDSALCKRLLQRATSTLRRAISQEEIEKEAIVDCKLLLATGYYLLNQLADAQQLALYVMREAQEQETSRAMGRSQLLLGRIFAAQQQYREADDFFEQAMIHFHRQQFRLDYARTLYSYGLTLVQRSQSTLSAHESLLLHQRGMSYLSQARNLFADAHATLDLTWTECAIETYKVKSAKVLQ